MTPVIPTLFDHLFSEATQRVLTSPWKDFLNTISWDEVLPCPDLSAIGKDAPSITNRIAGIREPTKRELQLVWENRALEFYTKSREDLLFSFGKMEKYLSHQVTAWNMESHIEQDRLSVFTENKNWLHSIGHLSLIDAIRLPIEPQTARQFIEPKCRKLGELYRWGHQQGTSQKNNKSNIKVFIKK